MPCYHFSCVYVVLGSVPFSVSFVPYPVAKFGRPSSHIMVALVACVVGVLSMALICSAPTFSALQKALTSMANSTLCFCVASSLMESFCFCIIVLSHVARSGVCHSRGHESSMVKMALSIEMKGILVQFYAISLRVLIYTLCLSTLMSTKPCKQVYTMGDKPGLLLIHVWTLASIRTYKTLVSRILMASFVAQSNMYFVTSSRSYSRGGN